MAKQLKINIKNKQLTQAIKLNKLKKEPKAAPKKEEPKKAPPKKETAPKPPVKQQQRTAPTQKRPPQKTAPPSEAAKPKKPMAKLSEVASKRRDARNEKQGRKQESFKPFDSRARLGLRTDEEPQPFRRRRPFSKYKSGMRKEAQEIVYPKELKVRLPITVKDLAQEMKRKASELISKLFMQGIVITINDYLEDETTVQLLGHEFNCEIEIDTTEQERLRITSKTVKEEIAETPEEKLTKRPPIVTFMGHVDHGKTSLIDAVRKSDVASGEAGAITQHIGAFKCHREKGDLTIIDTPGHEAFTLMRERGVTITDIVVLVIAGDEGMKPQTIEAMNLAKETGIPMVVAINKSDKPDFNAEDIYRQLAEHELLPEAWGGETLTVNCSAVSGEGIDSLLEMLLLQAEMLELKADTSARPRGSVIESEIHKGFGVVATLLVMNGTLKLGEALVFDDTYGRVKTMHDEHGKAIKKAGPATPVKVTGLAGLPEAGDDFIIVGSEKEARNLSEERATGQQREKLRTKKAEGLESIIEKHSERAQKKVLPLILRADVQGSLEALKNSLLKIPSDKVELNFVSISVGEISESDVQLAAASGASIIGFHTRVESHAEELIKRLQVTIKHHDIIYHAIDDVKQLMVDKLDKIREETEAGSAEVRAVFKSSQLGLIAGCMVTTGTVKKDHIAKLLRDDELIWEGNIESLKRGKEDAKEVNKGTECGILLKNFKDFKEGDLIKTFDVTYITQEL